MRQNPSTISAMYLFLKYSVSTKDISYLIFHVSKSEGVEIFSDAN